MLLANFVFFLSHWLLLSSKQQNISGAQQMSHPTNNFCIFFNLLLAPPLALTMGVTEGFCPLHGIPGTDPQGYTCGLIALRHCSHVWLILLSPGV